MPSLPERFPYRKELEMPVIGLEAEFKVFVDDEEIVPESFWGTPSAFIDRPLLKRSNKSSQLPTGGAVYFDGGVIEVVTPVIEIAPQCTARVVRSLWEQIAFVRDQLDRWESRTGQRARLQGFSCHFNISYEIPRGRRSNTRTIQKLAMLLAHLLPVPVILLGANRRSTGMGVRPRRDRIEITLDFTPDPGLMAATTALIVGVVREVISWPSYLVSSLEKHGVGSIEGIAPGRHATRNGWLARSEHFPRNPFEGDINAAVWKMTDGRVVSMRQAALEMVSPFRESIRRYSDAFSYRLLFSVLRGGTPSLLDLDDRPPAYDDVGRSTRWGAVIPELRNFESIMHDEQPLQLRRRRVDLDEKLTPPWRGEGTDRRRRLRDPERRKGVSLVPSSRLTRSAYEKVFLRLGSGKQMNVAGELLTPVAVRGWYHSLFRTTSGEERLISIDQLLRYL